MKVCFDICNNYQGYIACNYLDNIREHFSVENPIAKFSKFKKNKFISKRLYSITPSGKFNIGLLHEIQKYLTSLQIPCDIVVTMPLKERANPSYNIKQISTLNKEARDYQTETVGNCLKEGRGVIVIGTAGGKTLTMAILIKTINDNMPETQTLIIVPSLQLVEQTYNDFIEYGINAGDISKWSGDNIPDFNSRIIVAGANILRSKCSDLSILKKIKLLIIDECLRKNTLINTESGYKKIQDIKLNDMVLSKNVHNNNLEYKKVLKLYKNLPKSINYNIFIKIVLENNKEIYVTPNHKIKTNNRGFIRADMLKLTDDIDYIDSDNKILYEIKPKSNINNIICKSKSERQ